MDATSDEFQKKKGKSNGKDPPKKAEPSLMERAPPKGDIKNPFEPRQWSSEDWRCCCKLAGRKCHGEWRVHDPTDCKRKAGTSSRTARKNLSRKGTKTNPANSSLLRLMRSHRRS
jgi:hypothetical protein